MGKESNYPYLKTIPRVDPLTFAHGQFNTQMSPVTVCLIISNTEQPVARSRVITGRFKFTKRIFVGYLVEQIDGFGL